MGLYKNIQAAHLAKVGLFVDVGDHAQQLKVETTQPNRVIGRGQVHKDHADLNNNE